MMLNGETTECRGEALVELLVNGTVVRNRCLVAPVLVCGADVILELDIIKRLRGVAISKDGSVSCGVKLCGSAMIPPAQQLSIDDTDFSAAFDGHVWTVKWKWRNREPRLSNN